MKKNLRKLVLGLGIPLVMAGCYKDYDEGEVLVERAIYNGPVKVKVVSIQSPDKFWGTPGYYVFELKDSLGETLGSFKTSTGWVRVSDHEVYQLDDEKTKIVDK